MLLKLVHGDVEVDQNTGSLLLGLAFSVERGEVSTLALESSNDELVQEWNVFEMDGLFSCVEVRPCGSLDLSY